MEVVTKGTGVQVTAQGSRGDVPQKVAFNRVLMNVVGVALLYGSAFEHVHSFWAIPACGSL